jgi:hypothetical protein
MVGWKAVRSGQLLVLQMAQRTDWALVQNSGSRRAALLEKQLVLRMVAPTDMHLGSRSDQWWGRLMELQLVFQLAPRRDWRMEQQSDATWDPPRALVSWGPQPALPLDS